MKILFVIIQRKCGYSYSKAIVNNKLISDIRMVYVY